MRKDEKWWGYWRYDMRYDPTFMLKAKFTQAICPGGNIGELHPQRVERECVTDLVEDGIHTLEDLGVQLTPMENQVPWELRPYRAALYYDAELGEFETPPDPRVLDTKTERKLFAWTGSEIFI